jgi:hypothetical protein
MPEMAVGGPLGELSCATSFGLSQRRPALMTAGRPVTLPLPIVVGGDSLDRPAGQADDSRKSWLAAGFCTTNRRRPPCRLARGALGEGSGVFEKSRFAWYASRAREVDFAR